MQIGLMPQIEANTSFNPRLNGQVDGSCNLETPKIGLKYPLGRSLPQDWSLA